VHAFAAVPASRHAGNVRYLLPAVLELAVSSVLANHRSVLAIAEWGAHKTRGHLRCLEFLNGCAPGQPATIQLVEHALQGGLAQRLTTWFQKLSAP
jgi:hypothetical protein